MFNSFINDIVLLVFYMIIAIYGYYRYRTKRFFLVLLIAVIIAMVAKHAFYMQRPCFGYPGCPTTSSYPSGHALLSFAMAMAFFNIKEAKKESIILLLLSVILSYLRFYVHFHYIRDLIGGMAFGAIVSFASFGKFKLYNNLNKISPLAFYLITILAGFFNALFPFLIAFIYFLINFDFFLLAVSSLLTIVLQIGHTMIFFVFIIILEGLIVYRYQKLMS